jgi:hypothetical protein
MRHLLQVWRQHLEVVGLARLDPEDFRARRRFGQARDQRRRRCDGMIALPAHFAQIRARPIIELHGAGLGPLQQPRHLRSRKQGVVFGLERRQLLAAHVGAAAWHHHRRIPSQQRQCAAKCVQSAKFLFKLFVGSLCHDSRSRNVIRPVQAL